MAKTKTAAIPKSKAKTAYGLLSEVAKIALAEPKRMRMAFWGGAGADGILDEEERPSCGTVGCIGGWIEVLKPQSRAWDTLAISRKQQDQLFFGRLVSSRHQGTPRHAQQVAALIARFQQRYEKQLKAKRV